VAGQGVTLGRRHKRVSLGAVLRSLTVFAFVISLVVQVAFPLGIALMYRRKTLAPWRLFLYGALVYAVFQIFTWLPISVYLDATIGTRLDSEVQAFVWLLAEAFATALIEELGRLWAFKVLFQRSADPLTWRNGVMYGLGHGATETMLLIAGLTFISFSAYLALNLLGSDAIIASWGADATPALREALESIVATDWEQPLIVAFERVVAVAHQVAWSLLVMQSLVSRQKRWFGFALLYHGSIAVIVPGLAGLVGFPLAEAANAAFGLLSLRVIFALRATRRAMEP